MAFLGENLKDSLKKIAGSILFFGGIIYILGTTIGNKYNSLISNSSILFLGVSMIIGAYFIQKAISNPVFSILLVLAGIGAAPLGLLSQDSMIYFVFAGIEYVAFGLCAIISYKLVRSPLGYFSIILGIVSYISVALWISGIELSPGISLTPIVADLADRLWLIGFGAYIIGNSK